ncbi:MAG: D-2-hydroxyacid dehydrogenase [Bacteroidales bacterium]|nr:D-2-hydroxyacid dehydrogenase [Candidatus Physcousia equi]
MKHKIVILDGHGLNPGDFSWDAIAALGDLTVYERTAPEDVVARCNGAQLVLTNKVVIDASIMAQLATLRFIGVLATGYNTIDIDAARQRGIVVSNIPAYSTPSVAQHTFALLLAVTNRVEHYTRLNCQQGKWASNADFCYWDTPLTELDGKRFGIYGMGRIGARVAQIAMALGMEVVCLSRKPQDALPQGVKKVADEEFWTTCDIVTLHCPLTPETTEMVSAQVLQRMKHGAILLNTSRGGVINEADVAAALRSGQLAAYAADVLTVEPPTADNPLLSAPHVFLTPHIAWATTEARQRLMDILVENVKCFLAGTPQNVVNG